MSISPELLAEVLHRQGLIDAEQATAVKKEARLLPARVRSSRAYELRALGYEVVTRLGFRIPGPNGQPRELQDDDIGQALARDAGMDFVRIDTLSLDADLIEKQISRPFARKHRGRAVETGPQRIATFPVTSRVPPEGRSAHHSSTTTAARS